MTISLADSDNVVHVTMSGKLTKEDYEHFVPLVDKRIAEEGPVRMIVEMKDFHGWNMAALWEDTKFAAHHFSDIEKIAMIGDSSWEHGMARFCAPFTKAKLKYFDVADKDEAKAWVTA